MSSDPAPAPAPGNPVASPAAKLIPALVLLLLGAIIVAERFHVREEPLEGDITTYAVVAREMLAGRPLYTDVWDHKPPGVHLVFAVAQLIAGPGSASILLINIVVTLGTLLGVYTVVRLTPMCTRAALWAAALWTFLAFNVPWQANQPNVEGMQNLLMVWILALFLWRQDRPLRIPIALLIGLLASAATILKHIAIFPFGLMALAYIACAADAPARLRRFAHMAVAGGVILIVWIVTGSYFAAMGRWTDFYEAVFVYNRSYIHRQGFQPMNLGGLDLFGPLALCLLPAAVALLPRVLAPARPDAAPRRAEPFLLGAALALGSAVAIILPGWFYRHYFQLYLPSLAISLGWGLGPLFALAPSSRRWVVHVVGAAAVAPFVVAFVLLWRTDVRELGLIEFESQAAETWQAAPRIQAMLQPGERFWNLGSEPGLYYLTGQPPPTGLFYDFPLFEGPLTRKLTRRTLAQLEARLPEMVVIRRSYMPALSDMMQADNSPFFPWLKQNYGVIPDEGASPFVLLALKGSKLEERIARGQEATGLPALPRERGR